MGLAFKFWTGEMFLLLTESPVARSETNIMDALKSESPSIPTRKSKIETIRNSECVLVV